MGKTFGHDRLLNVLEISTKFNSCSLKFKTRCFFDTVSFHFSDSIKEDKYNNNKKQTKKRY